MIEIKISGRGGQGAVLASQIIAAAMFEQGWWVQAFPSFGAERRGAPVSAFLRADREEITLRCGIRRPDWIILFEANLLENPMVMGETGENTSILINAAHPPDPGRLASFKRKFRIDAVAIAEELGLKTTSFSIVNTAMVGAFAAASGLADAGTMARAVGELVPVKREENVAAARKGYETVREIFHA